MYIILWMCTYIHSSVQPACMLTVVILSTIHTCTWLEHTLYLPLCNSPCPMYSLHCITCGYAVIHTGRGARNLELWVLKSSKYFTCYCCYVVCHIPNILYRMVKQETLFDFGVSSPLPYLLPSLFLSLPPSLPPPTVRRWSRWSGRISSGSWRPAGALSHATMTSCQCLLRWMTVSLTWHRLRCTLSMYSTACNALHYMYSVVCTV